MTAPHPLPWRTRHDEGWDGILLVDGAGQVIGDVAGDIAYAEETATLIVDSVNSEARLRSALGECLAYFDSQWSRCGADSPCNREPNEGRCVQCIAVEALHGEREGVAA